jgi:GntR family phosphonate transport system transcriptional regulator
MAPIARRSGVTRYREVDRAISDRIDRGQFPPGAKLPSENELAQTYGVNRLTVRRALFELSRRNVIRTEHGVGSFVREPSVLHRVDDGHAGFAESMAARGLVVTHELISIRALTWDDLDDEVQLRLPDSWPRELVQFSFRRLLGGTPWSLSTVVMSAAVAPIEWDAADSLTAILADRGIRVVRAERGFAAAPADEDDAHWLDIDQGMPVLVVTGLNADYRGDPVMFLRHRTRADRAEYVIRLTHPPHERD